MPSLLTISLSTEQEKGLQQGYKKGQSHEYRKRCHLILLKAEGRTSLEVSRIVGCCEASVNNWLRRYEAEGLQGLMTKPGRGRKSILDKERDRAAVEKIVKEHRQRLDIAKSELEKELHKSFSKKTLVRFLKVTAAPVLSASGEGS